MRVKRRCIFFLTLLLFANACQAPVKKDEVVIRSAADPETLNPISYSTANAAQIISLLYQSLLTLDLQDHQLKPLLVERLPQVTQVKEKSYFTYRLRKEAVWDDNKPVTAQDIAFSLKVIKAPLVNNEKLRAAMEFVRDVKSDPADPKKFTIECEGYVPEMSWQLGDFAVLPAHVYDPQHLLNKFTVSDLHTNYETLSGHADIKAFANWFNHARFSRNKDFLKGSGGYELADWKTGQQVVLKKKLNWWGSRLSPQVPYITAQPGSISFRIIPENTTAVLALKNEKLDVYSGIPPHDFIQLKRNKSFLQNYSLFTPATYDLTYIGINGRNEKFSDKDTRQALAHLLDIPKIIKVTQQNFAVPAVGLIRPSDKKFYNTRIQPYSFNLQEATRLLQTAGWRKVNNSWQKQIDGETVPLTINLSYKAGNTEFENIAFIFQEAAAKVNIPVQIQPTEGVSLGNKLRAHQFEVTIRYFSGNPGYFNYKPILHTESAEVGGMNFTGFGNAQSDALIEEINQTNNLDQKAVLVQRFQEVLHDESNLIILYFNTDRIAVHNRFSNLKISGYKPGYDISAFTIKNK